MRRSHLLLRVTHCYSPRTTGRDRTAASKARRGTSLACGTIQPGWPAGAAQGRIRCAMSEETTIETGLGAAAPAAAVAAGNLSNFDSLECTR
jgi:hypothetical protein